MSEKGAYTEYDRIVSEYKDTIQKMNIQEQKENDARPTNDHDEIVRRAMAWDRKREAARTDAIRRLNLTGMQSSGNFPI